MHRLYALLLLVALSGCGAATPSSTVATPSPATSTAATPSPGGDASLREGVLAGDPSLEGGCVWLETAEGRLEVAWPPGYTVSTAPIALRDPTGAVVAARGDRLRVRGAPAPERVSICQVGEQWTANTVEPAS